MMSSTGEDDDTGNERDNGEEEEEEEEDEKHQREDERGSSDGLEPPQTTILILGRSGTGKSSLCQFLLKEFEEYGKPIRVLNDRTENCKYQKISWSQLAQLKHVALIVEDIISASPAQFRALQELLNFSNHHRKVNPILCVSHALTRNNIHALLPYFNRIFLSANNSGMTTLRTLLNYFGYDKQEKAEQFNRLKNLKSPFCHFFFDVDKGEVGLKTFKMSELDQDDEDRPPKKRRATQAQDSMASSMAIRFLSVLRHNSDKALAIFDLLYPGLPAKHINPNNLTIKLKKRSSDKVAVTVSLLDYISALVDEEARPSSLVLKFHRYVRDVRRVHLPHCFVANKSFWM